MLDERAHLPEEICSILAPDGSRAQASERRGLIPVACAAPTQRSTAAFVAPTLFWRDCYHAKWHRSESQVSNYSGGTPIGITSYQITSLDSTSYGGVSMRVVSRGRQ